MRWGEPSDAMSAQPGVLGEIVVRAAHARNGYDRLWLTEHRASQPTGWHRSGDVGQLDAAGRLWVGGRLGHVIHGTLPGPIAPVENEQRLETLEEVDMAAVVGIGPMGAQACVAVLQIPASQHPSGEASLEMIERVPAGIDRRYRHDRRAGGDPSARRSATQLEGRPFGRRSLGIAHAGR